jgi:hypothetical protein
MRVLDVNRIWCRGQQLTLAPENPPDEFHRFRRQEVKISHQLCVNFDVDIGALEYIVRLQMPGYKGRLAVYTELVYHNYNSLRLLDVVPPLSNAQLARLNAQPV